MPRNRWALAAAVGAFTTTLIGGVALAGFQPFTGPGEAAVGGPTTAESEKDAPKGALKAVLDRLVAKNTITQAQEDAILQAIADEQPAPRPDTKPARPAVPSVKSFIGDLTKAAGDYLGMDLKTLLTQLRGGKSLADLANGLSAQGKSASGLIDTLTKAADAKVDQAVTAKKLTPEQAASLKAKLATEITAAVNRSFTKVPTPKS